MTAITLYDPQQGHGAIKALWLTLRPILAEGKRLVLKVEPERRSSEQNSAQWPILDAFARQKKWPVNGELTYMDTEDWKDLLTAAFRKEQIRLAKGIDGGVVMVGLRTSKFSKAEFSEWLEFLHATAAHMEVEIGHD